MKLEIINASCGYGRTTVVKNISMNIEGGEIFCILGPKWGRKSNFFLKQYLVF